MATILLLLFILEFILSRYRLKIYKPLDIDDIDEPLKFCTTV
jgi:hypothetical protein